MKGFLTSLNNEHYTEEIEERLTTQLISIVPDQSEKELEDLAHKVASGDLAAIAQVKKLLSDSHLRLIDVITIAKANAAGELAKAYARSERKTVAWVNQMLLAEGKTLDAISSEVLANSTNDFEFLGTVERIHRLIANAESRRNEILRDLDRHRAILAETLRGRQVEQIDGDFRLIKPGESGQHDKRSES